MGNSSNVDFTTLTDAEFNVFMISISYAAERGKAWAEEVTKLLPQLRDGTITLSDLPPLSMGKVDIDTTKFNLQNRLIVFLGSLDPVSTNYGIATTGAITAGLSALQLRYANDYYAKMCYRASVACSAVAVGSAGTNEL